MNSPSRSNSKKGLRSTGTKVFLHAAAAGCRAAVITSVGSYVFVLRLFNYCMVMDSVRLLDL